MYYNVDGEGRVTSTNNGGPYLTGTAYNPAGQITQTNYASTDSDTYAYDPNTGRMTQYQFNVGALHQALTGNLTWNANGSLQNLNTQDLSNAVGTQNCNYQHDDLSRIENVSCGGNQLQNPGFESGNADWNLSGNWSIVNNAANAQSGSWYLSGSSTGDTGASATSNGSLWIPVTPGEVITIGGWIKRVGGTGILDWSCQIVDANYNVLGWCLTAGPWDGSGGTNWQLYTNQTIMPANAAYIQFYAEIHCCNDSDTSLTGGYFDSAFIDGAPVWAQTFTYDAFGNIDKTGNSSFNPFYSSATNRMTQIGPSTPSYDANGNVTNDFLHTYAWDANGRPVTIDGVGVTYDALGSMVEQNRGGTYTQFGYSTTGQKLQLMSGQSVLNTFVPLVGGAIGVWPPNGTAIHTHFDWLGNARLATTSSQTVAGDVSYAPFGETYDASGTPSLSFTGMDQGTTTNEYDFPAREYGIQGRWPSPDPAGIAAVDPSNPQSWNRYAYVDNNPLAATDPTGLFMWGMPVVVNPAAGGPCIFCDIAIGFFDLFSILSGLGPTPQAAPAPPGGYGAGIDPYGTWTEQVPAGVQVFPSSVTGIPNGSGCTYGSGSCGGMIYGFTAGGGTWLSWQDWLNWLRNVAWLGTAFIPIGPTGGTVAITLSAAHVPQGNVWCLGAGVALQTPSGKVVSGGPLTTGNLKNAKNILSGWSWSFGGQATPGRGVQTITNKSGSLSGPTVATGTGASAGGGGMACTEGGQ